MAHSFVFVEINGVACQSCPSVTSELAPSAHGSVLSFTPSQMGNWKNATVLFLHSNKLESLPEEMGDMQKLKVINLSNNK